MQTMGGDDQPGLQRSNIRPVFTNRSRVRILHFAFCILNYVRHLSEMSLHHVDDLVPPALDLVRILALEHHPQ